MAKYRLKAIEAEQFDPSNDEQLIRIGGIEVNRFGYRWHGEYLQSGDWLVHDERGRSIWNDRKFRQVYEPVPTEPELCGRCGFVKPCPAEREVDRAHDEAKAERSTPIGYIAWAYAGTGDHEPGCNCRTCYTAALERCGGSIVTA